MGNSLLCPLASQCILVERDIPTTELIDCVKRVSCTNHSLITIDGRWGPSLHQHDLTASLLVIIRASNVSFEATILNKPVQGINVSGGPEPLPYLQYGIATGAYSPEAVQEQINYLWNDSLAPTELQRTRYSYLQRNPQLFDGKATKRVVELLRHTVSSSYHHTHP